MDQADVHDAQVDANDAHDAQRFDQIDENWENAEAVTDVSGRPEELAEFHREQTDDSSCALFAQEGAMDAAGYGFDVDAARELGEREGWYNNGTEPDALGRVWEERGLETESSRYNGLALASDEVTADIRRESFEKMDADVLDDKAVMVAVETGPLPEWEGQNEGHALWVTGFEDRADGQWVVCNDSGLPGEMGKGVRYRVEDFDQAWRARGYHQVSTERPMFNR